VKFFSKTAWHFEQKTKKQGTAYDYFKQSVTDPSLLDTLGLDENTKQVSPISGQQKSVLKTAELSVRTCVSLEFVSSDPDPDIIQIRVRDWEYLSFKCCRYHENIIKIRQ
jgi:hypothetical protein